MVENLFRTIDVNGNGLIEYNEFRRFIEDWSYEDIYKPYLHVLRDLKEVIKNNNYDILNL
jgi:Ca2+-binding EF-hand superfamily protein